MPTNKISILVNGGMDNRAETELTQPLATQGQSIKLRSSINTRLTVRPGGVVRSPAFTAITNSSVADTAGERRYCLLSAANARSTLALRNPVGTTGGVVYGDAGRATYGTSTTIKTMGGIGQITHPQLAATLCQVTGAGSLGQEKPLTNVAVAYDASTGIIWTAYFVMRAPSVPDTRLVLSGVTADGVQAYGPVSPYGSSVTWDITGSYPQWIGLTYHGASSGMRLWYADRTTAAIRVHTFSLSTSSVLTLSAATTVTAIPAPGTLYGIDVCSGEDGFAYLICSNSATPANATIRRIDVATAATTHSASHANALLGGGQVAVSSTVIGGTRYVAASAGSVTNDVTTVAAYSTALATLWAPFTLAHQGGCGVGFLKYAALSTARLVYIISRVGASHVGDLITDGAGALETQAKTYTVNLTTGAVDATTGFDQRPMLSLQTHVAQWSPDSSTTIPVWGLGATYGSGTTEVGGNDYCDDPALILHLLGTINTTSGAPTIQTVAPIARLGVTRGTQSPIRLQLEPRLASKSLCFIDGDRAVVVYRQQADTSGVTFPALRDTGSGGRYAIVDFTPKSLSTAHDRDGSVFVAGALPLQFDGREVFECGTPLQTPHLGLSNVPSTVLTAGVYRWSLINQWRDSSGLLHRSRPGKLITYTSNGVAGCPSINSAYLIPTLSRAPVATRLYASALNGKTLHLAEDLAVGVNVMTPIVGITSNPMLYTTEADGAELAPQPPPPAWDTAIVGSRSWVLDAEVRGRWVHSKYRIAGVGYEFHPALEVIVPSSAGKGYACREWQGMPTFLCENGVYQTSGDGPANNGQGSPYAPPVKISDYGCTNTASVVVFPGGIIWQYGERFVTLTANGVQLVTDFACTHDVSCAAVATRYSEVLFFSATTAEVRVFNYEVGRWTVWDSETLPDPVTQCSLLPWDPDTILVYSQTTGITRRLDVDSVSAAAHMQFVQDWCLLGGDFQDHVQLGAVVFSATAEGPHGLEIDVYTDYNETATTTRTWSEAEITALTVNGRYTVRVEPVQPNCRAMRLRVRDVVAPGVNTEGFGPRALTVSYQIAGQLFEDSFLQNSYK